MARQRDAVQRDFERIDQPTLTALAFKPLCDDSRVLALLNRYEIRFERTYRRTIQALRDLRQLKEKTTVQSEPNPISEHPAKTELANAAPAKTGTDSSAPERSERAEQSVPSFRPRSTAHNLFSNPQPAIPNRQPPE